jgi:hypothetical protein
MTEILTGQFTCTKCGEVKPDSERKTDNRFKSGLSSQCKACAAKAARRWQREHADHLRAYRRHRYERDRANRTPEQAAAESAARKAWSAARPDYVRAQRREYLYHVTDEWYQATLARQNGRCAICGAGPDVQERPFAVDHDHACCPKTPTCGKCNRGLLCTKCNTAISALDKHADWVYRALAYLAPYRNEVTP